MCTPLSPYVAEREVRAGRSRGQTRQPVNPVRRAPSWDEAAGWPASLAWIYESLTAGPTDRGSVRLLSHHIIADNLVFFFYIVFSAAHLLPPCHYLLLSIFADYLCSYSFGEACVKHSQTSQTKGNNTVTCMCRSLTQREKKFFFRGA